MRKLQGQSLRGKIGGVVLRAVGILTVLAFGLVWQWAVVYLLIPLIVIAVVLYLRGDLGRSPDDPGP